MKKILLLSGLAAIFCAAAEAQVAQPVLPPGKIAVFKAGTSNGLFPIKTARSQPCYVEVFDTATTNQITPLVTVPMSTNVDVPGSVWINAHAGSEGGGISRSINREFLALQGYTGDILPANASKPSQVATYTVSTTNNGVVTTVTNTVTVDRGIVTLDAFTNAISVYSDPADWFGVPPGSASSTQDNPTGIATTDGTNFWGTGNFAGTSAELAGTLFFNDTVSSTPYQLQNQIQAAAEVRIIGGVLYFVVLPGNNNGLGGVFNFVQPSSGSNPGQIVPLPFDPNVPNPWSPPAPVQTNLVINWGTQFQNVANFDMNPQGTIAYGADETYGIVKFTNNAGTWVQAPYYFTTNNLGTQQQPFGQGGCFGICVDFSSTNPIIYTTTMEYGALSTGNSQGNPNANRLLKIVDTGVNPGTNLVAVTLATAPSINESFRGIDFTPDLRPLITTEPANDSSTVHGTGTFSLAVNSVYALDYQWLQITPNATNYLVGQTSQTLTLNNLSIAQNGSVYQCIVSNVYGAATSSVASLTVTTTSTPPSITNAVAYVTNFIGNTVTLSAIIPNGTQPFTYQWYQGSTPLSDSVQSADGANYSGSTNNVLTIANLGTGESGDYYLAVTNDAGGIIQLVDVLSVQYQPPTINAGGEPSSLTTFVGQGFYLAVTPAGGTQPFTYQWYQGSTALSDGNEFSGSQTAQLTVTPASTSDAGTYYVVVSNPGGSVTSTVATVSVLVPPPHSFVAYTNQIYVQNFDSLPDPGSNSVNSFNNGIPGQFGVVQGAVNGVAYSLANPFDFAYPVTSSQVGGLGLASTMPGWYGAADTNGGFVRFGAQDGDQTTGGVIDFGLNDGEVIGSANGTEKGTNRALGLLSTSTTGSTTFALKLVNASGNTLTYLDVSFLAELWRNGTRSRIETFGYTVDPTANTFVLEAESITNPIVTTVNDLTFSFPAAINPTEVNGNDPANQIPLSHANIALTTPWTPNSALWLIWNLSYDGVGGANGYGIDNLNVLATASPLVSVTAPTLGGFSYTSSGGLSFTFANTPGAAAQFTVYGTTNLALPFSQWQNLGSPAEITSGQYKFTGTSAAGAGQFYRIEAITPSSF